MSDALRVQHLNTLSLPNLYPGGDLPWQVYHTVRNAVVRCCLQHGTTGAMGECPITDSEDVPTDGWPMGNWPSPDFLVVDDQMNDERYIHLEINRPEVLTERWICDLMGVMGIHAGWGVVIRSLCDAGVIIFAGRIVVVGDAFAGCHDLPAVAQRARRLVQP